MVHSVFGGIINVLFNVENMRLKEAVDNREGVPPPKNMLFRDRLYILYDSISLHSALMKLDSNLLSCVSL